MHLYLWKTDESTDFLPKRIAEISVNDKVEIVETTSPKLEGYLGEVQSRPALPFMTESPQGDRMTLQEVLAQPGDEHYGYALAQTIERETGVTVTFTPDEPAF